MTGHTPLPTDPDSLGPQCCEQNDVFRRTGASDERFCLELFRLALEEERPAAWTWVLRCHENQVARAVRTHRSLTGCAEEVEDLVQLAFTKFARFARFQPPLPAIVSYLRSCADSVVIDCARRRQATDYALSLDDPELNPGLLPAAEDDPAAAIQETLERDALWAAVLGFAQDDLERLVAFYALHQGARPAEIQARFPDLFTAPAQVSQIRDNFVRRLKRNREILEPLLDDGIKEAAAYKPVDDNGGME